MKILNSIYSQFKTLSWLAVRILQATNCIFCATLLSSIVLMLFPGITGNHVQSSLMARELIDTSTRLLALGVVTAFASDIVIRT